MSGGEGTAPKPWHELVPAITGAAELIQGDPLVDTDLLAAQAARYLTRLISAGALLDIEARDPDHPRFVRPLTPEIQYALPAVDCKYLFAAVRAGNTYRIAGTRGTAKVFDVEVWAGNPGKLREFTLVGKRSEFECGPNGEFEVIVSNDEQPGNWLQLPDEGIGWVFTRQYFYDWDAEEAGRFDIERVGSRLPPPPETADSLGEQIVDFNDWMLEIPKVLMHTVGTHYAVERSTMEFAPLAFGWADLQYGRGHYTCAPDEAVVVEMAAPDCFYWNFQLASHNWEAMQWQYRQTSINGHQAHLDEDGRFRAVIAHQDPGVPNWLDCAGHGRGLLTARIYKPANVPEATVRTVPLAELRSALPSSTPTVSPDERDAILRQRLSSIRRTERG